MPLIAAGGTLAVLNTVVLQLRERVHDLCVFKSVGMTPRQAITMVVCSVTLIGLLAGIDAALKSTMSTASRACLYV